MGLQFDAARFLCFSRFPRLRWPRAGGSADRGNPGGEAISFLEYFELLRRSGERVVIDGPCFSACTLVLDIVPRSRICVTRRAVLGFHAARLVDQYGDEFPALEATRVVADAYPAPIRKWIRRHGGLTRRPIFLSGRGSRPYTRSAGSGLARWQARLARRAVIRQHGAFVRTPVCRRAIARPFRIKAGGRLFSHKGRLRGEG